jgi:hypothetical protein
METLARVAGPQATALTTQAGPIRLKYAQNPPIPFSQKRNKKAASIPLGQMRRFFSIR